MKRLARLTDGIGFVECPISDAEVQQRKRDYLILSDKRYASEYRDMAYRGAKLWYWGTPYMIAYNFCSNPFCAWYGQDQAELPKTQRRRGKISSRYRLDGYEAEPLYEVFDGEKWDLRSRKVRYTEEKEEDEMSLVCNDKDLPPNTVVDERDTTVLLSNWSLAEEIMRLATHDAVLDAKPEYGYDFHRSTCKDSYATPMDYPQAFVRKGKSTAGSQRYKCRSCGKMTNVYPDDVSQSVDYNRRRNDILLEVAHKIVGRSPVKQACRSGRMGGATYYDKLEIIYRRCLEFLEEHERQALAARIFGELWLCSDIMTYSLNNSRRRLKDKERRRRFDRDTEGRYLLTQIVATADCNSGYVFRSDLCFDYDVTARDIIAATYAYGDDHAYNYCRRFGRLRRRYAYAPRARSPMDTETKAQFRIKLKRFLGRSNNHVQGYHTNPTYTACAHYWLIQHTLRAININWVSDRDGSLSLAIRRIFSREIRLGTHHYYQVQNKPVTSARALLVYNKAVGALKAWGKANGFPKSAELDDIAREMMRRNLKLKPLYELRPFRGKTGPTPFRRWVDHPLPVFNEAPHLVTCVTDIRHLSVEEQAAELYKVNNRAVDSWFASLRRQVNTVERPLQSNRGESNQASFQYANWNPRYAAMAMTIARVVYNYCAPERSPLSKSPQKTLDRQTPAMRLGIAERPYTLNEIIYGE